jgi:hypothetical protein
VVSLEGVRPVLARALLGADPEDPMAVALEGEPLVFVHVQVPVAREDDQVPASGLREPRGVSSCLSRLLVPVEVGEGQAPVAAGDDPDPEAPVADRDTVLLSLVRELVDHGEHPLALVVLNPVGGFSAERVVGVGDVPAEPVVLDRGDGALPPVTVGPYGRSASEPGVEVGGRVRGEVGGPDAGVVAQLGVEFTQLGPGGRDLLAGGQTAEPLIQLAEPAVEPGESAALPVELVGEGGAAAACPSAEGGADGASLLTFELVDPPGDRRPLLGGAVMFGKQVGLAVERPSRRATAGSSASSRRAARSRG